MNEFVLNIHGEDNRVRIGINDQQFNLSPANARYYSDAIRVAADHADTEGHYDNEITIHYKEETDKQKVGFESDKEEKKSEVEPDE